MPDLEARKGVEALVKERPQLQFTQSYVAYLWQRLYISSLANNHPAQREVEAMMNDLIESVQASDEFRAMFRNALYPILIDLFETEAELNTRLRILQELEQMPPSTNYPDILHCKLMMLFTIGRMDILMSAPLIVALICIALRLGLPKFNIESDYLTVALPLFLSYASLAFSSIMIREFSK